jgi:tRNA threonylcarbamoyl adenosine modification protein (Sua5/YciO/YrdC/YwlC family)
VKILKINAKSPETGIIKKAVKILKLGGVIVYPTDTCYGLGADVTNPEAVKKIYKIKKRIESKPLSMIVKDLKMIENKMELDTNKKKIIKKYLPGEVTFIVLNLDYDYIKQNTLGIRIPEYNITKKISDTFNSPYTTTSANISGQSVCYSVEEVIDQFKNIRNQPELFLDAGTLEKNVPSTVVDIINWPPRILRQGKVEITEAL